MGSIAIQEADQDTAFAEARQREVDVQFTLEWSYEKPGAPVSLATMLDENRDDPDLCTWLKRAEVGEESRWGGGAAPLCVIRRVS